MGLDRIKQALVSKSSLTGQDIVKMLNDVDAEFEIRNNKIAISVAQAIADYHERYVLPVNPSESSAAILRQEIQDGVFRIMTNQPSGTLKSIRNPLR